MFRVEKFREPKGRDRVLSKEECEKLLVECAKSKNGLLLPIIMLSISTGLRQNECLSLTWDRVNLESGVIALNETKSGYPRSIALVGPALEHLKRLFDQRDPNVPFVFPSKRRFGKKISIRKAWEEALKRLSIKDLRFHDLRHTFCTVAASSGASNLELSTAMGHRSLQMLQRYTHLDVNHTKKLSEFVSNKMLSQEEKKK